MALLAVVAMLPRSTVIEGNQLYLHERTRPSAVADDAAYCDRRFQEEYLFG
jgi:hypothetical protein